jgi:hypothetical protein
VRFAWSPFRGPKPVERLVAAISDTIANKPCFDFHRLDIFVQPVMVEFGVMPVDSQCHVPMSVGALSGAIAMWVFVGPIEH